MELLDFEFYTTLKDAPSDKLVSFIGLTGTLHIYSTDASSNSKLFFVVSPLFNLFNFDIPADAANEVRGVVEGS
jgi:hypothetical protein